jgi:hypothetical protein
MSQKWIIIASVLAFALVMLAVALGPAFLQDREVHRLQEVGILTNARVVSFRDTGNRFNDVPVIVTTVEVLPKDQSPYQAEIRHLGYGMAAGSMTWVRVDPVDAQNVVFQTGEPTEAEKAGLPSTLPPEFIELMNKAKEMSSSSGPVQ